MKNYLILFSLFSFLITFSQSNKNFDYEKNSNPNPKNKLSLYFKENVKKKLLKKARFSKNRKNITLSFLVNQQGEPYNLNVASYGSKEFYTAIKETFKDYFLKNIGPDSLDNRNKYSLQIISKKGNKKIFNCSSKIIVEKPPICSECEDLKFYEDIKTCLNIEVKKHFYKNADFNILNKIKGEEVDLFIQFYVTKSGKLKMTKKSKTPLIFLFEADRVLSSFPTILQVSTKNKVKISNKYNFLIEYKKGQTPKFSFKKNKFEVLYKYSSDNDLSLFFIKKLIDKDLHKSNLSRIRNHLNINFELNKNQELTNFKTNSRSSSLEKKIIEIFKKYPSSKLNFTNKDIFSKYFIRILDFKDNQTFVNTNEILVAEKLPIFPGCENSISRSDAKKCFSRNIQMHFSKKFDADLPNRLGLKRGKKRVFISFKINKKGEINILDIRSPHEKIEKEVLKVMKKLPKIKPGKINDKPTSIKYSIPFTLIVE